MLIEDFWSYANRTLTSFGTLVANVWSYVTRTLTSSSGGASAQDIWEYSTRTLTSTPEQILEQTFGENVIVQRGDTLTWDFSGLGSLVGRTSLYITVKNNKNTEDSSSTIQASQSAGLLVLNGSTTGITAGWSVITILNESLGNIRWTLSAEATKLLSPVLESNYDIQISTSTSVRTLRSGTFTVNSDVTRRLV